jgi:hypothetical protein
MLKIARRFSQFYHPCRFSLPPQLLSSFACKLNGYVSLYRAYGHYYSCLDPLGLYNK